MSGISFPIVGVIFSLYFSVLLTSCGGEDKSSRAVSKKGRVESAAIEASKKYQIPARFILAAAWVESKLSAEEASSVYLDAETGEYDSHRGVSLANNAFGIPDEKLGLVAHPQHNDLTVQIDAYAKWLSYDIGERTSLSPKLRGSSDKFDWIWEIAKSHREGANYSRNVRVVFAREMINALNEGFLWQDKKTGEMLKFSKERPALKVEDFSADAQAIFQLTTQRPEIDSAMYLRLGRTNSSTDENKPDHIEIIHCPLTLSACLELQSQSQDDDVRLEAHFIIPQDASLVDEPLQVSKYKNTVRLTDKKGVTNHIKNAVVIMLVGNSGRIVNGYRDPSNPVWVTKWQLQRMGSIINDVCLLLNEERGVKTEDCMKLDSGVHFHYQGPSEAYRWGDVADFDPLIFSSYVTNPGGLQGETMIQFPHNTRRYKSGALIKAELLFQPAVQHIELERLIRCPDKKLVWSPISAEEVRSDRSFTFKKRLFDAGPNNNGEHFLRAKVYSGDGELLGWDVQGLYLEDYETELSEVTPKICLISGN